ncbi:hypothetical protein GOBAR_AA07366 [Gossypium barbadense]|uniref:Uncharacterized protein n=1 Tax=Gossypium barbadense TaxID=3634 RepID=A0A2P5YCE6_GOSBA|nr:hypothetical protein GOBAR_AA07366 [Gossypium barbadense]
MEGVLRLERGTIVRVSNLEAEVHGLLLGIASTSSSNCGSIVSAQVMQQFALVAPICDSHNAFWGDNVLRLVVWRLGDNISWKIGSWDIATGVFGRFGLVGGQLFEFDRVVDILVFKGLSTWRVMELGKVAIIGFMTVNCCHSGIAVEGLLSEYHFTAWRDSRYEKSTRCCGLKR